VERDVVAVFDEQAGRHEAEAIRRAGDQYSGHHGSFRLGVSAVLEGRSIAVVQEAIMSAD
jgi:hypothetical protein